MIPALGRLLSVWFAALLAAQMPLFAYEVPLGENTVREAYFLGQRHDDKTRAALAPYLRRFPLPEKGPQVAEIELQTPYAQIVQQSWEKTVGYSAQQAAEEYRKRGDIIEVRVLLQLTPTYPVAYQSKNKDGIDLRPEDFWKDFTFSLRQQGQSIEPANVYGEPQYGGASEGGGAVLIGAQVWLDYEAADVASDIAEVEIVTPDGQHFTAKFDLAKLR
jgi:hypothetical protein